MEANYGCPFEFMNLSKNADLTDIRQQYKKMSLALHPDKNKEDSETFKHLGICLAAISDPISRQLFTYEYKDYRWSWKMYDTYIHDISQHKKNFHIYASEQEWKDALNRAARLQYFAGEESNGAIRMEQNLHIGLLQTHNNEMKHQLKIATHLLAEKQRKIDERKKCDEEEQEMSKLLLKEKIREQVDIKNRYLLLKEELETEKIRFDKETKRLEEVLQDQSMQLQDGEEDLEDKQMEFAAYCDRIKADLDNREQMFKQKVLEHEENLKSKDVSNLQQEPESKDFRASLLCEVEEEVRKISSEIESARLQIQATATIHDKSMNQLNLQMSLLQDKITQIKASPLNRAEIVNQTSVAQTPMSPDEEMCTDNDASSAINVTCGQKTPQTGLENKKNGLPCNSSSSLLEDTSSRKYKCGVCGKLFTSNSSFSRHKGSHDPTPKFECKCGMLFKRKDCLVKHVRVCKIRSKTSNIKAQ